jgi:hypothetical protein
MTAQAFLMTIALGSDSSRAARTIAALLSLLAALATLQFFASNRRAELFDAHLLEEHEMASKLPDAVHGSAFRRRRDAFQTGNWYVDALVKVKSNVIWLIALTAFAGASVVTLGLAIFGAKYLN